MLFPPGSIGAYLDYRTQEVGVAAVWSGDEALKRDYAAGDIYHALARMCGLTMSRIAFVGRRAIQVRVTA
jgi:hypothetical protein